MNIYFNGKINLVCYITVQINRIRSKFRDVVIKGLRMIRVCICRIPFRFCLMSFIGDIDTMSLQEISFYVAGHLF